MPSHHFMTPKVTYIGSAYCGQRLGDERAAATTNADATRPGAERKPGDCRDVEQPVKAA